MTDDTQTIADRLQTQIEALTRAERQLADSILENYPVSGLGSITAVAANAGVSSPTVARMVQKLGFKGFPEFQQELRRELEAKISGPIAKHETWAGHLPSGHLLNRFTEAVGDNIRHTLAQVDTETFDATCRLLAGSERPLTVTGGRLSQTLADYLFLHLQMIRPRVTLIRSSSNAWPHYLLDVAEGDVFVIFDVRRYENNTLRLAEIAHERGARIVLFTDQWRSPISRLAEHVFASRIAVPSAWDSSVTTMLLLEALIAAVQDLTWGSTRERMETLEEMFDRTRLFRKFT